MLEIEIQLLFVDDTLIDGTRGRQVDHFAVENKNLIRDQLSIVTSFTFYLNDCVLQHVSDCHLLCHTIVRRIAFA